MEADIQFSPQIDKIIPALLRMQSKLHAVTKTGNNPFFKSKYAELDAVQNELKPILNEEKLFLTQWPCGGSGNSIGLGTLFFHESGQWIKYPPFYFESKDGSPQGKGGCITYMRRYSQLAISNMTQEDDDGNTAQGLKKSSDQTKDTPMQVKRSHAPAYEEEANASFNYEKGEYIIPFGKFKGKKITEVDGKQLLNYVSYLKTTANDEPLSPMAVKFIDQVEKSLYTADDNDPAQGMFEETTLPNLDEPPF